MFEVLKRVAQALDNNSLPYMVIGGQAVLLYGEPRFTNDIDITLGCTPERLSDVVAAAAEADLLLLPKVPESFVRETFVLPCRDTGSELRVDFVFSFSPYEEEALRRVNRVTHADTSIAFVSLEDLIVHKMIAGRPRDLEDVRSVVLKNAEIDWDYISGWISQFESAMNQPFSQRLADIRTDTDR